MTDTLPKDTPEKASTPAAPAKARHRFRFGKAGTYPRKGGGSITVSQGGLMVVGQSKDDFSGDHVEYLGPVRG